MFRINLLLSSIVLKIVHKIEIQRLTYWAACPSPGKCPQRLHNEVSPPLLLLLPDMQEGQISK